MFESEVHEDYDSLNSPVLLTSDDSNGMERKISELHVTAEDDPLTPEEIQELAHLKDQILVLALSQQPCLTLQSVAFL